MVFSTLLLTDMRKGELKNLTWNDVNFQLGIIFIQAKEGWSPKMDERITPISPVLLQILMKLHEDRMSTSGYLQINVASVSPTCSTA